MSTRAAGRPTGTAAAAVAGAEPLARGAEGLVDAEEGDDPEAAEGDAGELAAAEALVAAGDR